MSEVPRIFTVKFVDGTTRETCDLREITEPIISIEWNIKEGDPEDPMECFKFILSDVHPIRSNTIQSTDLLAPTCLSDKYALPILGSKYFPRCPNHYGPN